MTSTYSDFHFILPIFIITVFLFLLSNNEYFYLFFIADQKDKLKSLITSAEDWLYGDGFDSTKQQYGKKLRWNQNEKVSVVYGIKTLGMIFLSMNRI